MVRGVRGGLRHETSPDQHHLQSRRLDPKELPELVDRLYRAAWAMCGSPHDAEDLVQETFVRVLARPRTLRRREQLPYLMQALRNTYLTSLRTASRRPRTTELPPDESSSMRSSLAQPDVALEHRATLGAIAELPDDFRDTLVAVDVVGLSYREAARALDTPEATITTRLFRARERLARTLTDEPTGRGEATGMIRGQEGQGWPAKTET
jgi:RNA polymerase sigma-70 factor, ECF subfamily